MTHISDLPEKFLTARSIPSTEGLEFGVGVVFTPAEVAIACAVLQCTGMTDLVDKIWGSFRVEYTRAVVRRKQAELDKASRECQMTRRGLIQALDALGAPQIVPIQAEIAGLLFSLDRLEVCDKEENSIAFSLCCGEGSSPYDLRCALESLRFMGGSIGCYAYEEFEVTDDTPVWVFSPAHYPSCRMVVGVSRDLETNAVVLHTQPRK